MFENLVSCRTGTKGIEKEPARLEEAEIRIQGKQGPGQQIAKSSYTDYCMA